MIALSLTFPAGRYHATPWGRHVNEGAVEWPPSPWRLLRALVAVWKRTLPDIGEDEIKPIFEVLAAEPPVFVLPPASIGHTRHYMPWYKKGPTDRTLVFDAFVAIDPDRSAVIAAWPDAALDEPQRGLLAILLANLSFLGRAESWCEACLLTDDEAASMLEDGDRHHARSIDPDEDPNARRELELVRTLCPDPETAFTAEHVTDERQETAEVIVQTKKGIKTKKEKRTVAVPAYDPNWHLCMETIRLHKQKWSDPPGSRWITYTRERRCFEVRPIAHAPARDAAEPVHIARFALDSKVLPSVTETLPVAEAARRAIMSLHGRLTETGGVRGRSEAFSGKDCLGKPLRGHRHAWYLPTDEDGDGRLDHLTVYAADGFGSDELHAFERLSVVHLGRENRYPLRVLLLGTSAEPSGVISGAAENRRSPLGLARVWVSTTPYLITRHPKTRGRNRVDLNDRQARTALLIDDLRAQIRSVRPDLAEAAGTATIEPITDDYGRPIFCTSAGLGTINALDFKRFRRKASDDGGRRLAGAFRITFSDNVQGPLVFGHSSHFGLGIFLPFVRNS